MIVPLLFSRLVPAGKSCYYMNVRRRGGGSSRREGGRGPSDSENSAEWAVMKVPNEKAEGLDNDRREGGEPQK